MDELEARAFVKRARFLRGEHDVAKEAFEGLRTAVVRTNLDGFAKVELHRNAPILVVSLPAAFEWRALLLFEEGRTILRVALYRDGIELAKHITDYPLPLEFNGETFVGPIDPEVGPPDGYSLRRVGSVRVVLEQLLQHVLNVAPPTA